MYSNFILPWILFITLVTTQPCSNFSYLVLCVNIYFVFPYSLFHNSKMPWISQTHPSVHCFWEYLCIQNILYPASGETSCPRSVAQMLSKDFSLPWISCGILSLCEISSLWLEWLWICELHCINFSQQYLCVFTWR